MSPLKEIKQLSSEEASKIPWLHRARKDEKHKSPLEKLYDQVLENINNSESGVICLTFSNESEEGGKFRSQHEAMLTANQLTVFGREKKSINLQTRLVRKTSMGKDAQLYIKISK